MIESNEFPRRHIGPDDSDVLMMLDALNLESLDSLIDLAVPTNIREVSEPLTPVSYTHLTLPTKRIV